MNGMPSLAKEILWIPSKAPRPEPARLVNGEDELLTIFHNGLAPQIPFVVIPGTMTAHDLRTQKPMVYLTVMMAASYRNWPMQSALGKEILTLLAERVLFRGEKSMDLLQGLLIYIFWYANPSYNMEI